MRRRPGVVTRTQAALYSDIDLDLSWSEGDLPERERTKHVHRLHPYLGKFIPQLVEVLLARHFRRGQHVLDPFAGSGATLVQALESGLDATGVDIAAFNCLLMRVKTQQHNLFTLEHDLREALARFERGEGRAGTRPRIRSRQVRSRVGASAAPLPFADRRVPARRRSAGRARARRAVSAADDSLRSRLPARPQTRAVLVLQAPPRVHAGRERSPVRSPLHARHPFATEDVRARALTTRTGGGVRRRA